MTSKEFVLWLQGFTEGVHQYNITPTQWDILKDKLSKVNDEQLIRTTPSGISTSTTSGFTSGSAWNYTSTEKELELASERQLLTDNRD